MRLNVQHRIKNTLRGSQNKLIQCRPICEWWACVILQRWWRQIAQLKFEENNFVRSWFAAVTIQLHWKKYGQQLGRWAARRKVISNTRKMGSELKPISNHDKKKLAHHLEESDPELSFGV